MARLLHLKPRALARLTLARSATSVTFREDDDGTAVVIYGVTPVARFASLVEVLELHGLRVDDVEEREVSGT